MSTPSETPPGTAQITSAFDRSLNPSVKTFGLFFLRGERTHQIGRWRWLQFLVVEALFGEELLENLVICRAAEESHTVSRLVPRGILIDRARDLLVEVMYFKYHRQYLLIESTNPGAVQWTGGPLDLSHVQFRLKSGVAYEIIYFRRVYHAIFLTVNVLANVLVFFFSESWLAAVSSFAIVQLFKRVKL